MLVSHRRQSVAQFATSRLNIFSPRIVRPLDAPTPRLTGLPRAQQVGGAAAPALKRARERVPMSVHDHGDGDDDDDDMLNQVPHPCTPRPRACVQFDGMECNALHPPYGSYSGRCGCDHVLDVSISMLMCAHRYIDPVLRARHMDRASSRSPTPRGTTSQRPSRRGRRSCGSGGGDDSRLACASCSRVSCAQSAEQ